jgi:hypothetical protein
MASLRLRMTAQSLAGLRGRSAARYPGAPGHVDPDQAGLLHLTAEVTGFYERIAVQAGLPARGGPPPGLSPMA